VINGWFFFYRKFSKTGREKFCNLLRVPTTFYACENVVASLVYTHTYKNNIDNRIPFRCCERAMLYVHVLTDLMPRYTTESFVAYTFTRDRGGKTAISDLTRSAGETLLPRVPDILAKYRNVDRFTIHNNTRAYLSASAGRVSYFDNNTRFSPQKLR